MSVMSSSVTSTSIFDLFSAGLLYGGLHSISLCAVLHTVIRECTKGLFSMSELLHFSRVIVGLL